MASLLYPKAKEALLKAGIDFEKDAIAAVLLDLDDYAYDAAHEFLVAVPAASRVGTPQVLANKTGVDGVFDADDIVFPKVSGDECEALLLYQWTGVEETSRLIALIDSAIGLPATPTGIDIPVTWSNTPERIFAL